VYITYRLHSSVSTATVVRRSASMLRSTYKSSLLVLYMSSGTQQFTMGLNKAKRIFSLHNRLRISHVILNATSRSALNSFANRTIKSWNQLPAGLLASFPCKLNIFRKGVTNVATSKGIQVGIECQYVK
jgi:hypothetical protein